MPTSQTHPVLLIVSSGVKAVIFNEVLAEVDLVVEGCGRAVVFMSLVQISLSILSFYKSSTKFTKLDPY